MSKVYFNFISTGFKFLKTSLKRIKFNSVNKFKNQFYMKKITAEEFDALRLHGKGSANPLFKKLIELNVNEGLVILKSEWKVKYPPTGTANRVERRHGMKFDRGALPDRTGWAFKRVK